MIALLTDTAVAYTDSDALNFVHEWGVVVFEQSGPLVCGGPWNELAPDINDVCAEAPVVWIHGEPFSGTFTVELPETETFTMIYPDPDDNQTVKIAWEISGGLSVEQSAEEIAPAYSGPFSWSTEYWRDVPSLPLHQESSGFSDNFLYYECTVNRDFTFNFFQWGLTGNPVFAGNSVTEALYFTPNGAFPVTVPRAEFIPQAVPMGGEISPDVVPETFCRWADSRLKSSEITALWETWRPVFCEEDSYWLVFPIPGEFYGDISSILLESDANTDVEYERFFMGAVKLSQ